MSHWTDGIVTWRYRNKTQHRVCAYLHDRDILCNCFEDYSSALKVTASVRTNLVTWIRSKTPDFLRLKIGNLFAHKGRKKQKLISKSAKGHLYAVT